MRAVRRSAAGEVELAGPLTAGHRSAGRGGQPTAGLQQHPGRGPFLPTGLAHGQGAGQGPAAPGGPRTELESDPLSGDTRLGEVARNSYSRKAAAREREPWLIIASPGLSGPSARQLVNVYGRRMQIELSFRDLKSHRYGQGFEDSLTRSGTRLQVLLLVGTLAPFASWLAGLACEASNMDRWLWPTSMRRKLYSTLRMGWEALARYWPMESVFRWLERLRSLPPEVLDQAVLTA